MKKILFYPIMILAISISSCTRGDSDSDRKVGYLVDFDVDGGSYVSEQVIEDGNLAIKPSPSPKKEGYIFAGWLKGDVEYKFDTPVKRDIVLKARWGVNASSKDWKIDPIKGTDGVVITEYRGKSVANIVIPASVDTMKVLAVRGYNTAGAYRGIFGQGLGGDYPPNTIVESIDLSQAVFLKKIEDGAFAECRNLTEVKLPKGIEEIGYASFWECTSLKQIDLPSDLLRVGNQAFYKCTALENIKFSANISSVGDGAFYECSRLSKVEFYERTGIKELRAVFFGCTSLKNINIPEGVEQLGYGTFYNTALESIILPESLKYIEGGAFESCSKLNKLTIKRGEGSLTIVNYSLGEGKKDSFFGTPIKDSFTAEIFYPTGAKYQDIAGWKDYNAKWSPF